ncbi:MAG: DUF2059 domain-containing protein [Sulfurovum sp.]|nr:DUF2059 domain-containing protein [Sulfurovum sp.]
MTKQIKILCLSFTLLLPVYATAKQELTTETNQKKLDPAFINAAEKFFKSMNTEDNYRKIIDSTTETLIKANPNLKNAKKDIRAFYAKYIGWSSIKEDMIRLYERYYTIPELEDITNFYQTDTGQKTLKLMPTLYKEGQDLGVKLVQEHIGELKDIIQKSMKKPKEEVQK